MIKRTGVFFLLGILLVILILNTHSTLLGSGFIIGDGRHVITYLDLVREVESITVKLPNEEDIEAEVRFRDFEGNLAILKLKEMPKINRQPLVMSHSGIGPKIESVFALGYPWTNTLQDRHTLLEGAAHKTSMLIDLKMPLNPVHSGSPLFNSKQELVGIVLMGIHAKSAFSVEGTDHFAIPLLLLEKALKASKINFTGLREKPFLTRDEFIEKSRNNIVLIEAR
jgi:S1-C subfamily serine protease